MKPLKLIGGNVWLILTEKKPLRYHELRVFFLISIFKFTYVTNVTETSAFI